MTQPPASSTPDPQDPIVVESYDSAQAFADAARELGAQGYRVAGQTTGSRLSSAGSWVGAFGIILAILGFLGLGMFGLVAGIVLILIAAFSRQTTYTVTYQR